MDGTEQLVDLKDVKLDLYEQAKDKKFSGFQCDYDKLLDTALMRLVASTGEDEFVLFLNQFVSVIIRDSDHQVVGVMIEHYQKGFQKSFVLTSKPHPKPKAIGCFTGLEMRKVNKVVTKNLVPA